MAALGCVGARMNYPCVNVFCLSSLDRRSAAPLSRLVRHGGLHRRTTTPRGPSSADDTPALQLGGGGGRRGGGGTQSDRRGLRNGSRQPGPRSQGAMKKVTGMKNRGRVMEDNQRDNAPALWLSVFLSGTPGFRRPPPPLPPASSGFCSSLSFLRCSLFCSGCFRHCCPFLLPHPVMEG